MGLSQILLTSTSGLQAVQTQLQWRTDNISNAQDPTYARRDATTVSLGTHTVTVDVKRAVNDGLQNQFLDGNSLSSAAQTQDDYFKRVADILGTSQSTPYLQGALDDFTGSWKSFETDPTSTTSEAQIISSGVALAGVMTQAAQQLTETEYQVRNDVSNTVTTLNEKLTDLDQINKTLSGEPLASTVSPGLFDKRDSLVRDISAIVGVNRIIHSDGSVALYTKNGTALIDHAANQFQWNNPTGATPWISVAGSAGNAPGLTAGFTSGKIGTALNFLDNSQAAVQSTDPNVGVLAKARAQFDIVASQLADNTVPASGLVAGGSTTFGGAYFAASPDRTTDLLGGPAASFPVVAAVAPTPAGTAMSSFFTIDNNNPPTMPPSGSFAVNPSLVNGNNTIKRQSATAVIAALTDASRNMTIGKTGNTVNGSAVVNGLPYTSGLVPGMSVTGAGIPANTVVVSVNSATGVTLSNNATASAAAGLSFGLVALTTSNVTYSGLSSAIAGYQADAQAAASTNKTRLTQTTQTLDTRLSAAIGVNMDNEMAQLTVLQTAYQANAKVINAVQTMFDTLMSISK